MTLSVLKRLPNRLNLTVYCKLDMALIAIDNRFYIYRYLTYAAKAHEELTHHSKKLVNKVLRTEISELLALSHNIAIQRATGRSPSEISNPTDIFLGLLWTGWELLNNLGK